MPVGAIIGGVASIGGALLGGSAQKKAANKASDTAAQTAAQNNALQRETYQRNEGWIGPYAQRGNEAGNAINSLLGLGGTATASPQPAAGMAPQQYGQPVPVAAPDMDRRQQLGRALITHFGGTPRPLPAANAMQPAMQPQQPAQSAPGGPSPYQSAFDQYLDSTGYQFQVDQGTKAINQGYAGRGSLQSGAALKALQTYGQNTATGFFKDYLGLLSNQQGVGLSGANALAGVGTNYANSVSANNNNASSVSANAALQAGNANAGMYGNIAGAIGGVANGFGSSYRPSNNALGGLVASNNQHLSQIPFEYGHYRTTY